MSESVRKHILVPPELASRFDELAGREGVSFGAMVREAMRSYEAGAARNPFGMSDEAVEALLDAAITAADQAIDEVDRVLARLDARDRAEAEAPGSEHGLG